MRGGEGSGREMFIWGLCRLFILVLVGISILWIPVIQQMAGGQLYIYIQAVASYLSPPIAMVYCLAIAWPRMNEMGAFWSLMYGLTVGLVRMVLDFTFPEPLCLELDNRPAVVKSVSCLSVRQGQLSLTLVIPWQVHYMYFAAGLFLTTGLVGAVVSLLTQPPRDFMVSCDNQ